MVATLLTHSALNYNGNDTIVYQTCNSNCANACDTALIAVSICPVNDTPTIVCVVDTIYQGQIDTACISTNDVDGDAVTLSIPTGQNINGTAVLVNNCIVFTPNANFVGTQLIQVQACDSAGACSICTSSIEAKKGKTVLRILLRLMLQFAIAHIKASTFHQALLILMVIHCSSATAR